MLDNKDKVIRLCRMAQELRHELLGQLGKVPEGVQMTAHLAKEIEAEYAAAPATAENGDRLAELEAIVAKLPKTADGVPIVPGLKVYSRAGFAIEVRGFCPINDDETAVAIHGPGGAYLKTFLHDLTTIPSLSPQSPAAAKTEDPNG